MKGLEKAIKHFGSQSELARAVGISRQAVSKWRSEGVPLSQAIVIERVTNGRVTMKQLCPEAFKVAS